jgi:hypothetical protein
MGLKRCAVRESSPNGGQESVALIGHVYALHCRSAEAQAVNYDREEHGAAALSGTVTAPRNTTVLRGREERKR